MQTDVLRIAIIGSGFSGLCLGIRLKQRGIDSFTIFEKGDRLGGTWRDNTYPGAACDLPSFAYCFSFEQKTDWTRKWSPQEEILAYMDHCAEKYGLLPHLRFGTEIASARFDDAAGVWRIRTTRGEEVTAEVLVSGVGQLNRPHLPEISGLDTFAGTVFHSARWNHAADLAGKDVGVIGNAASAIQFVPQLAPRVRTLSIFQRTPNWMLPRGDRAYTRLEQRLYGSVPGLARLYRWALYLRNELLFYPVIRRHGFFSRRSEGLANDNMRAHITDPGLQAALIPEYPIGGKRVLISDDYFPTLGRPNVHVVTTRIDHVTSDAVLTVDGRARRVDALILATGFESTAFLAPMHIVGIGGRALDEAWAHGAEAFLGITVAGFPNFFMMYGPNTNLGHNSIIFMIECQTAYIMDCLRQIRRDGLATIDVRADAMASYNARLQRILADSAWAVTDRSWYKTRDGRITNNWSGTTIEYWWRTRRADLRSYHTAARSPSVAHAVRSAAA